MQTFLPYADFTASCVALDDRRLGKQRVETFQILRALTWPDYAWKNHPAVRMWRGFIPALVAYGLANCAEWVRRGNADTVEASLLTFTAGARPTEADLATRGQLPPWLGLPALHLSHRSALLRKEPEYYRPLFGDIPDDLPYLWPPDAFPRWPARRSPKATKADDDAPPDDALADVDVTGLSGALAALGYDEPLPGQAEAVDAVLAGRDVLGCFAARSGGTSAALLAGLALPRGRTTLWLSVHAGGGGTLPPGGVPLPPPRVREVADPPDEPDEPAPGPDEVPSAEAATDQIPTDEDAPASARSSTPIARPPSPVEVLAMAAEAEADPDFRFHRPADLERDDVRADVFTDPPALVVVDLGPAGYAADPSEDAEHADAVRALRARLAREHPDAAPPLLVVGPGADPDRRRVLRDAYGLADPVLVGGGADPVRLRFGVVRVRDENRRRDTLARLLAQGPKTGLVVGGDVEPTRRLARGLEDRGARVAPLLPAGRRSTTDGAVAARRRGALRALVFPGAAGVPAERLGRKDAQFVHVATLPTDRAALLRLVTAVPNRTAVVPVLLVLTDAEVEAAAGDPGYAELLSGRTCRRAALLDVVGEPVRVPCERCDVCLGVPAEELLLVAAAGAGTGTAGDRAATDTVSTSR